MKIKTKEKKYFFFFAFVGNNFKKTLIAAKHEDVMADAGCDGPKEGMMEGQT